MQSKLIEKKSKIHAKPNLRAIVTTAIMSALSAVLMMVSFSVPLVPSFLKLDFSELPALITSFAFGPVYGVIVCLIKNLINLSFTTTFGVGELSNFILGAAFVGIAGIVYHQMKNRKGAFIGALSGALAMSLIQLVTNYYIVYPVYTNFIPMEAILGMYKAILPWADNLWKDLFVFNLPFTLVKGLLVTLICFLIYKPISPLLKMTRTQRKAAKSQK